MNLSEQYWDSLYDSKQTGWDIGYVSTPLKEYFETAINSITPRKGREIFLLMRKK